MKFLKGQRGDTIVEVLISMTVLALVITVAYLSAGHSLQASTQAGNRNEALGLAQRQVEYIKNAVNQSQSAAAAYEIDKPYCISSDGTVNTNVDKNDKVCYEASQAPFGVGVSYDSGASIFTVTAMWPGENLQAPNQLTLYYKLPGIYSASPGGGSGPRTAGNVPACGTLTYGGPAGGSVSPAGVVSMSPTGSSIVGNGVTCNCSATGSSYVGNGQIVQGGPCPYSPNGITCNTGNGGIIQVTGGSTQVITLNYVCSTTTGFNSHVPVLGGVG